MLNQTEYMDWWITKAHRIEDPLVATLAAHVSALQDRIDNLIHPDQHDKEHSRICKCWLVQCACAYDHPKDVCGFHEVKDAT